MSVFVSKRIQKKRKMLIRLKPQFFQRYLPKEKKYLICDSFGKSKTIFDKNSIKSIKKLFRKKVGHCLTYPRWIIPKVKYVDNHYASNEMKLIEQLLNQENLMDLNFRTSHAIFKNELLIINKGEFNYDNFIIMKKVNLLCIQYRFIRRAQMKVGKTRGHV